MNKVKVSIIGTVGLVAVFIAFKMSTHDTKNHVSEKHVVENKTDPSYLKNSLRVVPGKTVEISTTFLDSRA